MSKFIFAKEAAKRTEFIRTEQMKDYKEKLHDCIVDTIEEKVDDGKFTCRINAPFNPPDFYDEVLDDEILELEIAGYQVKKLTSSAIRISWYKEDVGEEKNE